MAGEKCYGVCPLFGRPILFLKDPAMIKQFFVKDFEHFVDRNSNFIQNSFLSKDLLTDKLWRKSILLAKGKPQVEACKEVDETCVLGDDWKDIRTTFCPIFTSAKIKQMAPLVTEVSSRMVDSLERYATKGEELDLRALFAKYTMDSLASCAFGVNAQSFSGTSST